MMYCRKYIVCKIGKNKYEVHKRSLQCIKNDCIKNILKNPIMLTS